jgi:hypothetical protein
MFLLSGKKWQDPKRILFMYLFMMIIHLPINLLFEYGYMPRKYQGIYLYLIYCPLMLTIMVLCIRNSIGYYKKDHYKFVLSLFPMINTFLILYTSILQSFFNRY